MESGGSSWEISEKTYTNTTMTVRELSKSQYKE